MNICLQEGYYNPDILVQFLKQSFQLIKFIVKEQKKPEHSV